MNSAVASSVRPNLRSSLLYGLRQLLGKGRRPTHDQSFHVKESAIVAEVAAPPVTSPTPSAFPAPMPPSSNEITSLAVEKDAAGAKGVPGAPPETNKSPKSGVGSTGDAANKISQRRARQPFEPGDLTQLAALSALLRIENKTALVTEDILIALLSSPSAAESYARELARRLALVETERKVNTVVGLGVGILFANAIARALEIMYREQGSQQTISVLPVEGENGTYKLSYAVTKDFIGGSKYILLAMPVITSESWQEIGALDSLIKTNQTAQSGIARLVTVIQYETPAVDGEPPRDKRLPTVRLMKSSFE